ncbi:hypothetical protein [Cohnella sp. GCM10027633]|uniref:hypothetical protein n=1 Tax=unclassified Cohnella TaxID=2636738 RepID=UPI00363E8FD2
MSKTYTNAVRAAILIAMMATIAVFPLLRTGYAHASNASSTVLELSDSRTMLTFSIDEKSAIELSGGDLDLNGTMDDYEFDAIRELFEALLLDQLALSVDGERAQRVRTASFGIVREEGTARAVLQAEFPPAGAGSDVDFADRLYEGIASSGYANALTVREGSSSVAAVLSGVHRTWDNRNES